MHTEPSEIIEVHEKWTNAKNHFHKLTECPFGVSVERRTARRKKQVPAEKIDNFSLGTTEIAWKKK